MNNNHLEDLFSRTGPCNTTGWEPWCQKVNRNPRKQQIKIGDSPETWCGATEPFFTLFSSVYTTHPSRMVTKNTGKEWNLCRTCPQRKPPLHCWCWDGETNTKFVEMAFILFTILDDNYLLTHISNTNLFLIIITHSHILKWSIQFLCMEWDIKKRFLGPRTISINNSIISAKTTNNSAP